MTPDWLPINDLTRHNQPLLDELDAVAHEVFRKGWYVLGSQVQKFEREFAAFCGIDHCIGVGNGTDALELALRGLGIGRDDRVATVANAGMYATTAILAVGALPHFVDIDPDTLCLDPSGVADALTQGVKAVVVTHLYGRLAAVEEIVALCAPTGTPVVEDCAQAHGAQRTQRRAGAFGTVACFSFYPTKNLGALGDGGALTTTSPELAEKLRALRQYGWVAKYTASVPGGRNSRLDELQAGLLTVKLPYLELWNERRRAIARTYINNMRNVQIALPDAPDEADVAHLFVVRCRQRAALRAHLERLRIGSDVHYPIPDYRQPCLAAFARTGGLEVTEQAAGEVLSLPCFPEMTDAEVQRVIDGCNSFAA